MTKTIQRDTRNDGKEFVKQCECCGKEMERCDRFGNEYKICRECAMQLLDLAAAEAIKDIFGVEKEGKP